MKNDPATSSTKLPPTPLAGRDHLQGPIDAPISLVEYGDYECPFCGAAYPVVKAVQAELGDKLCFVFRNFPLTMLHPNAQHAAEAAEAAGAQGKFWAMHDALFENQEELADADIARYATALKLDSGRLMEEVLASVHAPRVREDFRSGMRSGVNGTPTFFINGVRFVGHTTVEGLLAALTPHHR